MAENAVDMDSIEDAFPLSGSQRGILFHAMQSEVRDTYVAHISLRLDGELDVPAFKAAWDTVIEHQPSLRASFVWEGLDEPLQVIHRDVKPEWRIEEELSSCSLEDVLEAESLRPFQLGQAPLFRFVLYRESARHHRLIWSVHHLLADGWSTPIILEQVLSAYAKSLETTTTTLNAVPVDGYASQKRIPPASTTCVPSYREYVLWQRELDTSEARSYWQNYLRGQAPTPLRLMTKTKPDVNIPLAQRRRVGGTLCQHAASSRTECAKTPP